MDNEHPPISDTPPRKLYNAFCYARAQETSLDGRFPLRMAGTCRSVLRYMVLFASHSATEYAGHPINRGQIAVSQDHLSEQTGFSRKSIRNALKHLQNQNEICQKGAIKGANGVIVYAIINYELWDATKIKGPAKGHARGQQGATLKEVQGSSKEVPEEIKPLQVYPPEVETALKNWTDHVSLPSTASLDACRKTLSELHRIDKLSWGRINAICEYAAREWVPQKFIGSPVKLRQPTRSGEMKTWEAIERQLSAKSNHVGARNGYPGKESPADTARALRNAAESLFNDGLLVVGGAADQNLLPESNHTRQGRSGRTPVLPASVDGEMRKDV